MTNEPAPPTDNDANPWRFCLAPMMDWSDRHCRYFWRILSKHARLYTEMVVCGAIIHGDKERFLNFNPEEHPLALQLGGSDANDLAQCASIAQSWGYDEVNLNCGCPSDRVQKGKIGAVLMHEPELVAECVEKMQRECDIPVTVKHRIGVDEVDDYAHLHRFVQTIKEAGCQTFIVHARKAWLKGLSPKQNREVPPLQYEAVIKLKQDFPELNIVINGGITHLEQSQSLLNDLDGVMIGREAYSNPYMLAEVDRELFGEKAPVVSREEAVERYMLYCEKMLAGGARLNHMARHILGLYSGQRGARLYRRHISEHSPKKGAGLSVLSEALAFTKI